MKEVQSLLHTFFLMSYHSLTLTTTNSKMSSTSTLERPDDSDGEDKEKKKAEQFTLWVKEKSKELKVSEEYYLLEFFRD